MNTYTSFSEICNLDDLSDALIVVGMMRIRITARTVAAGDDIPTVYVAVNVRHAQHHRETDATAAIPMEQAMARIMSIVAELVASLA